MFNVFYPWSRSTMEQIRSNPSTSLAIAGLSFFILALNAAGQLHLGPLGLLGLTVFFLVLGLVGCYWYAASIYFLTQGLGQGRWRSPDTHGSAQPGLTSLQGLWPLILLGPALSAQRWWPSFGNLFTFGILITTGFTLLASIRNSYNVSWSQAGWSLALTVILGSLALLGVFGWPMMLVLGANKLG
ncbi:MAG: hypothetical protein WCD18_24540 [Thermosynechococcaceae cyanobacterium]